MSRPDTSVCFFDSTMPGAPALSGQNGALIAILDACLVNGFGLKSVDSISVVDGVATINVSTGHSAQRFAVIELAGITDQVSLNGRHKVIATSTTWIKVSVPDVADCTPAGTITVKVAGAGWTKVFSGTNSAVYRSADGSGQYYKIQDDTSLTGTTAQFIDIRGFETMTDISTGTGQFPAPAQNSGRLCWAKSNGANTTVRAWSVICNGKFVYVGSNHDGSTAPKLNFWLTFGAAITYKQGDQYNGFIACASGFDSENTIANSSAFWSGQWASNYRFMCRDHSGIGGSSIVGMQLQGLGVGADETSGFGPYQYPDIVGGGLRVAEINIVQSMFNPTILRGKMPGAYSPLHNIYTYIPDGTVFDSLDALPGRSLALRMINAGSNPRGFMLDLTGPWE